MLMLPRSIPLLMLLWVFDAVHLHAGIVLKVGDVAYLRSELPKLALVPFLAISDSPLSVSGFNFNIDIGGDGQGPLPVGVTLPASLPDNQRLIARGGEVNARNWLVDTVDARNATLTLTDIFIIGNGGVGTDIPIQGNTSNLTGGSILFYLALQLDSRVADRINITMPNELVELPQLTDSLGNALTVTYLPGSITLSAVPEPGSIALTIVVLSGCCSSRTIRRIRFIPPRS
ncbi:MAG: hypothetical protein ACK553_08320 [Planctomycetota bacterium]|jgi:hypothetical protein